MAMPGFDPEKHTICDVIRYWAEVQPDAPALLEDGEETLLYGQLIASMDGLRRGLNEAGFGRGNRIAVVLGSGKELAAVILGVISGATLVPLDPRLKMGELENALQNRGAQALVTDPERFGHAVAAAEQAGLPVLSVERLESGGIADLPP